MAQNLIGGAQLLDCEAQNLVGAMENLIRVAQNLVCAVENLVCAVESLVCGVQNLDCVAQNLVCAAESLACETELLDCGTQNLIWRAGNPNSGTRNLRSIGGGLCPSLQNHAQKDRSSGGAESGEDFCGGKWGRRAACCLPSNLELISTTDFIHLIIYSFFGSPRNGDFFGKALVSLDFGSRIGWPACFGQQNRRRHADKPKSRDLRRQFAQKENARPKGRAF